MKEILEVIFEHPFATCFIIISIGLALRCVIPSIAVFEKSDKKEEGEK